MNPKTRSRFSFHRNPYIWLAGIPSLFTCAMVYTDWVAGNRRGAIIFAVFSAYLLYLVCYHAGETLRLRARRAELDRRINDEKRQEAKG